jgi:hypothetical protein
VIFTEFGDSDVSLAAESIEARVTASLQRALAAQQLNKVHISFYAFPDSQSCNGSVAGHMRRQVTEANTEGGEFLVACGWALRLPSRVAELCSPGSD